MRKLHRTAAFLVFTLAAVLMSPGSPAAGQTPPQELTRSQIGLFNVQSEFIDGAFPGLLLIPNARSNYRDEKYHEPYRLTCHVYAEVPAQNAESEPVYQRRFLVCAADEQAMTLTRQIARFLLLLYGERHDRIRDDHPRNLPTVNVWLTERVENGLSPDTGGEQFQNQIYLYNIHRERPAIEWARETAHEYGHYALPGVSGFKEPEEWANGVLGERLFLKWIRDDLRAGRLKAEDLAFVDAESLDEFYARVIWPLIRRILRDGMDARLITRINAAAMDYYTGLALFVDTLYGTRTLVDAIADTRPASSLLLPRASDFLTGVLRALGAEKEIALTFPALGNAEKEKMICFYLPAGAWDVSRAGNIASWRVDPDPTLGVACTPKAVTVRRGGWYHLNYMRSGDSSVPARLVFRKRA